MNTPVNSRGFTLLELLIAITIFAIISLASFSLLDTVMKSEEKSTLRLNSMNDIQRAFILMERDFLQIAERSVRLEGDEPLQQFIYTESQSLQSSSQAIGFVRGGWSNPGLLLPRGDMQSVAYQVNEETLQRIHYNFVDAALSEAPKIRTLLTGINDIRVEFYYGEQWSQSLQDGGLPNAIAIELDTQSFGLIKRKFLVAGSAPQPSIY